MNVSSVTSLLPSYLLPSNSAAGNASTASSASSVQQQADQLGISPAASFLNQLQQLQTQSPQQFQAIISQITGQLQQAASTASGSGNTAQANQLTQLVSAFQGAASGGPLPTAQQLQQAGLAEHHHHGGGHHGSGSSALNAYNPFQAANATEQNQSLHNRVNKRINRVFWCRWCEAGRSNLKAHAVNRNLWGT
jgi:hypothetical protein